MGEATLRRPRAGEGMGLVSSQAVMRVIQCIESSILGDPVQLHEKSSEDSKRERDEGKGWLEDRNEEFTNTRKAILSHQLSKE